MPVTLDPRLSAPTAFSLVALALLAGCSDGTPPVIRIRSPLPGVVTVNAGSTVIVDATDDDAVVELELRVDDKTVQTSLAPGGAALGAILPWSTTPFAAGTHELTVLARDPSGNEGQAKVKIDLADAPIIRTIGFTNQLDDGVFGGLLDIEVHLYAVDGDQRTFLGCSGEQQGLEDVDVQNTDHEVQASFIHVDPSTPITMADLAGKTVSFVVIEDDEFPCPMEQDATIAPPVELTYDDLLGESPPVLAASLGEGGPLAFDDVTALLVTPGRIR